MSIIVFGSINMDLVAKTHRLPQPGETFIGQEFFTAPGGKGANQAVAAARLGIPTYMVGRVGSDSFGQELLASLQTAGVNANYVFTDKAISSGVAIIAVDDRGENTIIIIPGANGRMGESDLERLQDLLPEADVLLLQLEIPLDALQAAARAARQAGVTVILDPAPARFDLPEELYSLVDIITPNEIEAAQLTGLAVDSPETASQAAAELLRRGVGTAIIKLGDRGVVYATAEDRGKTLADKNIQLKDNLSVPINPYQFLPAFSVEAVDTVAAGDAFNGAMAAALASGKSIGEAVVWGAAAGALCATKPGAQPSMPDRATFDNFLSTSSL
ncbi:MAG: ribokinase [Oscillatoria sp. SIO1A7]|nr:ribokinase [Oscillatoria sp. SIO1A7]